MRDTRLHDPDVYDRAAERDRPDLPEDEVRVGEAPPGAPLTPDAASSEEVEAAPGLYGADREEAAALFPDHERNELRSRWEDIQAEFVDEPRQSVEEADRLVADTVRRLQEGFADARRELEESWKGGDVSTEDLRLALRRYRAFFGRLLST